MKSTEEVKRMLDSVDVVCPECGKRPEKCTYTTLPEGYARNEMACCHGTGSVMIHVDTGYVVDSTYANTSTAGGAAPAFIPLAFAAGAGTKGATVRTIGWLQEKLPVDDACTCDATSKQGGFWGKVKQCLSCLWH